ncbi:MAG: TadE/TadG family type IV pilus assembly protein [Pseudomonadota bacterium]
MVNNARTRTTQAPVDPAPGRRARQRGVAAVEFAVILPVLLVLLAFPIIFGRAFMHYSVAQKAAHDAARYLSSIPLVEMQDPTRVSEAEAIARQIVADETAELNPGHGFPVNVTVQCDSLACGFGLPAVVTVSVRMRMFDDYFNDLTWMVVGEEGISLRANVSMAYVGN